MAFQNCSFTFDGIPCEEYGLCVYNSIGSTSQGNVTFTSAGTPVQTWTSSRANKWLYGNRLDKELEFTMIFGADESLIDANEYFDRFQAETIASWLVGHQTFKWLEIEQPDMEWYRFRCTITKLDLITYSTVPWAFSATVTCDSPFAYTYPEEISVNVSGSTSMNYYNRSTYNGYFKPRIDIHVQGANSFSVINQSDGNREMRFSGLPTPTSGIDLYVDCDKQIIRSPQILSPYENFNKNFLRLKRGDNMITINTQGTVLFTNEFLVNVGG